MKKTNLFYLDDSSDSDDSKEQTNNSSSAQQSKKQEADPFAEKEKRALFISDPTLRKHALRDIAKQKRKWQQEQQNNSPPSKRHHPLHLHGAISSPPAANNSSVIVLGDSDSEQQLAKSKPTTTTHTATQPLFPPSTNKTVSLAGLDPKILEIVNSAHATQQLAKSISDGSMFNDTTNNTTTPPLPPPLSTTSSTTSRDGHMQVQCVMNHFPHNSFSLSLIPSSQQPLRSVLGGLAYAVCHVTMPPNPLPIPLSTPICNLGLTDKSSLLLHLAIFNAPSPSPHTSLHSAPSSSSPPPSSAVLAHTSGGSGGGSAQPNRMVLKFRCGEKLESLAVDENEPMSEVFARYGRKTGADVSSMTFDFDGDKISPTQTAKEIGMEEDDLIDVLGG